MKYWSYLIEPKYECVIRKKKNDYLPSIRCDNVDEQDIIFICTKTKYKITVFGVGIVKTKLKINDGMIIFGDDDLNKFRVKMETISYFDNIDIRSILEQCITYGKTKWKSKSALTRKYFKGHYFFNELIDSGPYIFKQIKKTVIMYSDDCETEYNESVSVSENIIDDPSFIIPILLIPCDEFKIDKNKSSKYVYDHLLKCSKCDLTNNNDFEIYPILLKGEKVRYLKLDNVMKTKYLTKITDAYISLKTCKTWDDYDIVFIKNNIRDDIYRGCIMIVAKKLI